MSAPPQDRPGPPPPAVRSGPVAGLPIGPGPAPGGGSRTAPCRRAVPGLGLAVCGTAAAWAAHRLVPAVPFLTAAVALGVLTAHVPALRRTVRGPAAPGLTVASRRLMRLGIVLLGLKLSLDDVLGLGWATVAMVLGVVAATFLGTWWLGRRLGLPGHQPVLVAAGYAICGASAIGAVSAALAGTTAGAGNAAGNGHGNGHGNGAGSRAGDRSGAETREQEDIATSVAVVTLCGTLAMAVLPLLQQPLGLGDAQFGRWVGASVHDVGQVVASAQTAGPGALGEAVLVKLMRVALLAPLVAVVAVLVRSRRRGTGAAAGPGRRPSPVPLFVAGFLVAVALRSTGTVPDPVLGLADTAQELLLAAALFALGSAVHLPSFLRTGGRTAALGLCAWGVVAGASYAGVLLTA